MMPCILIGDSIAVGVGQARPECETVAQVGISSERYIATMLPPGRTRADMAVISLGVNDDASLPTLENLRVVRGRMAARQVVWLLPGLKDEVRSMIRAVAAENGDRTVDTRPYVGRDHLHPNGAGYETIASQSVDGGGGAGVEVAYAPSDREELARPLRITSTPRDRIRRLRAMRHAELTGRGGARVEDAGLRARLSDRIAHRERIAGRVERVAHGGSREVERGGARAGGPGRGSTQAHAAQLRTKVVAACARPCKERGRVRS